MILFQDKVDSIQTVGWIDILSLFGQTIIALVVVCAVAFLILRYILPKFNTISTKKSLIQIVDNVALDLRKRLVLIEIAGKYLLVAVSENGVQMISELDGNEVKESLKNLTDTQNNENKLAKNIPDSFKEALENIWKKSK